MPSYKAKPAAKKPATKPKMPMPREMPPKGMGPGMMPPGHAHMTPEEHKKAMAKMAKKGK